VDGTDFHIRQPSLKTDKIKKLSKEDRKAYRKSWFTHKFNGAGLRYEVGICIATGNIVWVNGPFKPGIFNDLAIFKNKLIHYLIPGEQVEADKGYYGLPLHISTPIEKEDEDLTEEEKRFKKYKHGAALRHETVNHVFKTWEILNQVYRHDRKKYGDVFWAIATLTQICFDMGEKHNYQVEYVGQTYAQAAEYLEEFI
jgi:DDE superfamily endonuclease